MSDPADPQDRKTLGLFEYRLDRHGEQIKDLAVRLRVVEERHSEVQIMQRELSHLQEDVKLGFEHQGEEITALRRAVVGSAIAISGSCLMLAATVYLAFG